jgi:hypothetical protein
VRNPRLAIVLLLVCAAWLLAPPSPPAGAADPWARALQTVLGPLRAPVAGLLRLRAGFARDDGRPQESVRFQQFALEMDPRATDSVIWLANELATQIPSASASAEGESAAWARLGIAALRRARALGNRDHELLDWESFLWVERAAPRGKSTEPERRAALDAAIAASEESAHAWIGAAAVSSALLAERALLRYRAADFAAAADDFERAAQFERLLAQRGDEHADLRAKILEAKSSLARVDSEENPDAEERAARLTAIEALRGDDPFLPLARTPPKRR